MTKEYIVRLFPNTKNTNEVVEIIDKYKNKFGLNTNLRLAHFLAQVREEIGTNFKVQRENLNYHEDVLPKIWPSRFTPELSEEYGRDYSDKANQEAIANIAYSNKLGNGNADSDGDGDMDKDDDGFKYRGAGCLQVTGKYNFNEVQKRCLKYANKETDPDTLEGFILFGMAFWIWKDLYRIADKGIEESVSKGITYIVNRYTKSYNNRYLHFKEIEKLI